MKRIFGEFASAVQGNGATQFFSTPEPGTAVRKKSADAPDSPILELGGIKVTLYGVPVEVEHDVHPVGEAAKKQFHRCISVPCKSWMCPECRVGKGIEIRKRLIEKAKTFIRPRLYTITVNRDLFSSPEVAYHYVMEKKFISRLLTKEMKIRRWVWVLEAQEENGDGWPHWHILIDVGALPGMWYCRESRQASAVAPGHRQGWRYIPNFFDLNRVHHLLRKWGIGEQCYLSVKHGKFSNPVHAINYITKYLIKSPRRGFPPWMLKCAGLRFYQPSRDLGSLNDAPPVTLRHRLLPEHSRRFRSPVERIAECRNKVLFVHYDPDSDKNIYSSATAGIKESVPYFPGAVKQWDFDFQSKKSFEVCGFESATEVKNFIYSWSQGALVREWRRKVEKRERDLLSQWERAAAIEKKDKSCLFFSIGSAFSLAGSRSRPAENGIKGSIATDYAGLRLDGKGVLRYGMLQKR